MTALKRTVLQLISSLDVGGAERLLVSLLMSAATQSEVDYVVVVMNQHIHPTLRQEILETGFPVYFLNRREGEKNPKYLRQLIRIIRKHQVQVLHAHNMGSKLWGMLCKICFPRLKLVFTVHSTRIVPYFTRFDVLLHNRMVDRTIAISKSVLAECNAGGLQRVTHIYNGIETKRYALSSNALPEEDVSGIFPRQEQHIESCHSPLTTGEKTNTLLLPPSGKRRAGERLLNMVQVARITHTHKGQDILIRALHLCKIHGIPFTCRFIGNVYNYDQASYAYLQALVNEYGLSEEVAFLTNRTDIPQLLQQADLFVLPSRYEGLGLAVLEAMAAQVPVIASDVDGLAELIEDNINGFLFRSEDPQHLYEKIKAVYDHPQQVRQVVERAFAFVQQFDIADMQAHYEQLYVSLFSP